ncbi:MAG TPA: hypothetical protein VMM18_18135 [Gemmatimonadaceae bacterium]|nr:hypothetical protein [Gemmatimonadaceae bacterium]
MSALARSRSLSFACQRVLPAIVFIAITGACASLRSASDYEPPRTMILFENNSAEPVRVFLVERHGAAYRLGKVHPMQSQALFVPDHLTLHPDRQVALVVVPLSRERGMHYPDDQSLRTAYFAPMAEVASQRWTMTSLFLSGSGVAPR